jgi:hypothetical protein
LLGIAQRSQCLPRPVGITSRWPKRRLVDSGGCAADRQQAKQPLAGPFDLRRRCVRRDLKHEERIASPVRQRIMLCHRILSPDP